MYPISVTFDPNTHLGPVLYGWALEVNLRKYTSYRPIVLNVSRDTFYSKSFITMVKSN